CCCRRRRTSRPWRWRPGCCSPGSWSSSRCWPSTWWAMACAMPPIPTATEPLLRVRDLRVSFRLDEGTVRAVDGVSFDVFPGQVVGIVGESGCGKSVTMRAVLQLIDPPGRITGGEILYRQGATPIDLARLPPRGRLMRDLRGAEIALIPQEPMAAFSPVHTVGAQIVEAIMLHERPITRDAARAKTVELFRDVGISMAE